MEFCPSCGKVLSLVKKSDGVVLKCKKCGYEKPAENIKVQSRYRRAQKVIEVGEESGEDVLPTVTDIICPNCGNREAYWWTVQTRSADEPMTTFFRCTRCKHTWREYG